jgi:hypothetical protein
MLKERGLFDFMDFKEAVNRVLKRWYEQRIQEETERNRKLRELHDNLTKIKIMKEEETMKHQQMEIERRAKSNNCSTVGGGNSNSNSANKRRGEKAEVNGDGEEGGVMV